jgi:hypothetical protein
MLRTLKLRNRARGYDRPTVEMCQAGTRHASGADRMSGCLFRCGVPDRKLFDIATISKDEQQGNQGEQDNCSGDPARSK